jgi:hypothetical protein
MLYLMKNVFDQNCLPEDPADSGMGTMSTNTHSQETRDSFQTVNGHISSDPLPSSWKYHPKGLHESLNTDFQPDKYKETASKQTANIISR